MTMDWFLWLVVGWWVLGALLTVAMIGRPRTPVTPGGAVFTLVFNAALIAGLLVTR